MLELKQIKKEYLSGENKVEALKGIDIEFRKSEFVSILRSKWMWKNNFIKYNWRVRQIHNGRFNNKSENQQKNLKTKNGITIETIQ